MSTHNLCFEQKYENYQIFLFEHFQFLEVEFSIYSNRHVFVMRRMGVYLPSHPIQVLFYGSVQVPLKPVHNQ